MGRDEGKIASLRVPGCHRLFIARVFGRRPKTCRPLADEAPRRTRENTSGTQGKPGSTEKKKEYLPSGSITIKVIDTDLK